jgi:hypothetical protein
MRLKHVSHIASRDQIIGVINRTRFKIGTTFIDAATDPNFGSRNFTAQVLDYQYSELVCSLDLSVTDATPLGRVVKKKALNEKLASPWFEDEIKSGQTYVSNEWIKPETIHCGKEITSLDLIVNDSVTRSDYLA